MFFQDPNKVLLQLATAVKNLQGRIEHIEHDLRAVKENQIRIDRKNGKIKLLEFMGGDPFS